MSTSSTGRSLGAGDDSLDGLGQHAFCGHVAAIQQLAGVASMRGKGAAGAARVPRKHLTMTRRPAG
jgi:hypothetical protein